MSENSDPLKQKRRELMTRKRQLKTELTRITTDISAIDRVLVLMDPAYQPEAPILSVVARPTSAGNPFDAGAIVPAMLDALRTFNKPVTASDCAQAMLKRAGHPVDHGILATVANRVSALLGQKAERGQVRRVGNGEGRALLWAIAS